MTADSSPEAQLLAQLGWVRRLAFSLAHDLEVAADLTQDVVCEWVGQRPTWAQRGAGLRGWLARATRSHAIDQARSDRARRARERSSPQPGAGEPAEAVLERLELQRRVAAAVQALPEPYRRTILYRYLDELPLRRVAQRMGVTEPTARKRIERGLDLLRARLDAEFGRHSRVWASVLLAPVVARSGEAGMVAGGAISACYGVALMGGKKLVLVAVAIVMASVAWWVMDANGASADLEVGGRGVVVPASVAALRQPAAPASVAPIAGQSEASMPRTAVDTPSVPAVVVRGLVFVDERQGAPADLAIACTHPPHANLMPRTAQLDTASASWSIEPEGVDELTLWVTSTATVPAQIPVPKALLRRGGTLDLHLESGRSLALLFLDEATRQPLADLEFDLWKAIEVTRRRFSVGHRGEMERHRTDAHGKAVVQGLPRAGYVSVATDVGLRERELLMRDGKTMRGQTHGEPIWSMSVTADQAPQLEQTILTHAVLGEGWAAGQVPEWAVAKAAGSPGVRVVARKWSDDERGRGDAFVLSQNEQGHFELRAKAPGLYRVWLERGKSREPLSGPVMVGFDHAGVHDPIVFVPIDKATLQLHCRNVPSTGQLLVLVAAPGEQPRSQSIECDGKPKVIELSVTAGEELQLVLHEGPEPGKSAWRRQFVVGEAQREIDVDLAGSWRRLRIENTLLDWRGEGGLTLLACRGDEVALDERILVVCSDGRATSRVHVPAGRWLYTYTDAYTGAGPNAIWGVVDIGASQAEVLLQPPLLRVPVGELLPGLRFDEVEGLSLRALPERLRTWQVPAGVDTVVMPLHAVYRRLAMPR